MRVRGTRYRSDPGLGNRQNQWFLDSVLFPRGATSQSFESAFRASFVNTSFDESAARPLSAIPMDLSSFKTRSSEMALEMFANTASSPNPEKLSWVKEGSPYGFVFAWAYFSRP
jgi:hypothetical protein